MNNITIKDNDNQCCGCRACENICPKKAITMKENIEGFLYPVVDREKCIDCGLCLKVCPFNAELEENTFEKKCYAATTKNNVVLENSTSGGIFYEFAKNVIDNNGDVYDAI